MANQFRVRRGLIVNGSGSALLDIQGSQGQLFSVTDQLSGSLFSVSDASGIPVLEAFSDTSVRLGLYGAEAIIVSGSNARITGSLLGTASFALSASWAPGGGGGGSLTGGAADYVAVWNSTTTLTTRSLYDNGNVGIGTTAPVSRLQISGSNTEAILRINSPASASILVVSGSGFIGIGTSTPTTLLHVSGTTGGVFEVDGAGAAGVNAFYVSSSGNVGIGTTNTTFRLFVTGSTNTVNFKGSGSAVFSVDGTSGRLFQVDDSLTGSLFSVNTAAGLPLIEAFSDNTVLIGQYGQNTLYVSQSRVGIGTTIPASRLHVSGTTGGAFQVNGAAATLAFYVSASGRVGIGTTTLLNTFHVVGTGRFTDSLAVSTAVSTGDAFIELGTGRSASGNAYLDLVGDTTYTDYGLRIIRGSAGANATSEITHRGTGGFAIRLEEAAAMTFSTTNTARLTILSGGNVGIGTTSPGSTLQINGNAVIGYAASTAAPTNGLLVAGNTGIGTTSPSSYSNLTTLTINGTNGSVIDLKTGNTLYGELYSLANEFRIDAVGASSVLKFLTNSVTRMTLDASGNLGIGTTTASSILHVSGTTGGVFRVNGAAAVNALFVSASGNVGIGTTSPDAALRVSGVANGLQAIFGFVDGRGLAISTNITAGTNDAVSILNARGATSGIMIFQTDGNERMRITSGGNVGIGTTAPTVFSGYTTLSINNSSQGGIFEIQSNGTSALRMAASSFDAALWEPRSVPVLFGTNNTERMRITSGGNVGIGTTSPGFRLDVQGGAIVNGNGTIQTALTYATMGIVGTLSNHDLALYTNNTEKARITSGGNVGIGAPNPTEKLVVHSGNIKLFSLQNVANDYRYIGTEYDAGNGNNRAEIRFAIDGSDTNTRLTFHTAAGGGTINERMRITSGGNVGIGTTSPESLLHIAQSNAGGKAILYIDNNATSTLNNEATIKFSVDAGASVTAGGAEISTINVNASNGNADLTFKTFQSGVGLTEKMRIANDGNVGIGTTSPAYQLQLSTDSAAKPSTNTWTISSDARIKENIKPYTKGLDALLQINPIEYDYNGKAGFKQGYGGIGIIAQDIMNVVPEGVSTYYKKLDENDIEDVELYNFNSHPLTYILINAIKELKAQNDYLQSQINELKS